MLKINSHNIVKISLLSTIFVSFNFDLNNSLNKYFIISEEIIYFSFFIASLTYYFKSKIFLKTFKEKIDLLLVATLIFIQIIFIDKNSYQNDVKLIVYTLPLIFLNNFQELKDSISLDLIIKILKFFLISHLVLIFFEIGIYHYYKITLLEFIFSTSNDISNFEINHHTLEDKSNYFNKNILKKSVGYRPELLLSNPITIFINFLLASIFIIFFKKKNKLKIFLGVMLVAILCKTRLIVVAPLLFINNTYFLNNKAKLTAIFFLIILFFYYIFIYNFNLLHNFKIEQFYNSRFVFYLQYIEQFKTSNLILPNHSVNFFNEEGNITGAHSDFIYLSMNYGLLFAIFFYFMIFRFLKKLGFLLIIILLISLFNGIIFSSFFWIFMYLFLIHAYFNNYSHN